MDPVSVTASNAWASRLFGRLAEDEPGNVVCSPLGAWVILAVLAGGAAGGTRDVMIEALGLPRAGVGSPLIDHAAIAGAVDAMTTSGPRVELGVSSALWAGLCDPPLDAGYVRLAQDVYGAAVEACDFLTQPETERTRINAWGARESRGRVPEVLAAGAIDAATRLVLTNAVYFLGEWASPFEEEMTMPGTFRRGDGTAVESLPMMYRGGPCLRAATPSCQAVELPFADGGLSMVFLLPTDMGVATRGVCSLIDGLRFEWVDDLRLTLPRFEMRSRMGLSGLLAGLGLGPIFDSTADFSAMGGRRGDLFVAGAAQEAFVRVDERGAEAAAVTAIWMDLSAGEEPLAIRFDRPFLFAIRDQSSGAVVFLGRVDDPVA